MTDFSNMKFRDDISVEYVQHVGDDLMCAKAAWVCTKDGLPELKEGETMDQKVRGTLGFLMKNRHGTPFEHGSLTLRVEAPIFVWREWHRHRVGWSYNEESGRYKQLDPVFYVPGADRREHCIKPSNFKPSKPGFNGMLPIEADEYGSDNLELSLNYAASYQLYERRLAKGYDNGLARICLPVATYSACYVTANPRSLMSLIELRTDMEEAVRRSHPLWEFHTTAQKVEQVFAKCWPTVHDLWCKNGRVAP